MFTGNFIGRCGKDAEIVNTEKGSFVVLNMAENYYEKGETKTRWIRVRCFTPQAQNMVKHWTKGRQLNVVGELVRIDAYIDRNGNAQAQLVVNAFRIDFVNTGKKNNGQNNEVPAVSETEKNNTPTMPFNAPTNDNDNLPF